MTIKLNTTSRLMLAGIALSTNVAPAMAEELAADLSQVGNLTFGAANLLPPGSSAIALRVLQYDFKKIADQSGDMRAPLTALDAKAFGAAVSVIHMTHLNFLGADYGAQVTLPYLNAWASSTVAIGPRTINADGRFARLLNLTVSPVMLVWRDPAHVFTQNFILDIQLPINKYQTGNPLNSATDAYALRPKYTFTWLTASGFETTSSWSYEYNFRNRHEDYKTGSTAVVNAAVGQHFGSFTAGVSGYAMQQLNDDHSNGSVAPNDGRKARVFSLGPALSYRDQTSPSSPVVSLKYLSEFGARNRSEGNSVWLLTAYPF